MSVGELAGTPGFDPEPQDVRWLTAEERQAWLAIGAIMSKLPAVLDAQLQRDADLTFFEYMVLAMLAEQDTHTMRMSAVADVTSGSISRLSHVATRLEQRGLVRRVRCTGLGRSTNLMLTQAGYDTVLAAAPGHVRHVRDVFMDALTPDQVTTLAEIGQQVRPRLESEAD